MEGNGAGADSERDDAAEVSKADGRQIGITVVARELNYGGRHVAVGDMSQLA